MLTNLIELGLGPGKDAPVWSRSAVSGLADKVAALYNRTGPRVLGQRQRGRPFGIIFPRDGISPVETAFPAKIRLDLRAAAVRCLLSMTAAKMRALPDLLSPLQIISRLTLVYLVLWLTACQATSVTPMTPVQRFPLYDGYYAEVAMNHITGTFVSFVCSSTLVGRQRDGTFFRVKTLTANGGPG